MYLSQLEVDRFRNLQRQVVNLHPRFNLIVGSNGQGKTNLLEAVVVLAQLRSFRAGRSVELLRFGEETARVRGVVEQDGARQELEVRLRDGGRRALVGGKAVTRAGEYLGRLRTVLFAPEDLQLPRGEPAERRRMLDRAVGGSWLAYEELLRRFQTVLKTRNRVLRERSAKQESLLGVYDQQLAELGSRVVASRRRYLRKLGPRVAEVFAEVSRSGVRAGLFYRSRGGLERAGDALGELQEAYLGELQASRPLDLARQTTTVGAQSDDVEFQLDGRSAGAFGSQGQLRALMLSFKLAQIEDAASRAGSSPLLLLDDVSSELDAERNSYLFAYIDKASCQTVITSARPELLPVVERMYMFSITNGEVSLRRGA